MRIKLKALNILYYFFLDLDLREKKIQNVLLVNKLNFEKYLNKVNVSEDSDISERVNFILYQLERLQTQNIY
jgi:hypothetical protein